MARLLAILRTLLSPLRTPLLPFRYISAWRTERYYERTLTDRGLAERWAAHYLGECADGLRVLDVGCGRGRSVALLSQLGHDVSGVDVQSHPWWSRLGERCAVIQSACLPWPANTFDVVLHLLVLQYLSREDIMQHAREAARVLKPSGVWIVLSINRDGWATSRAARQGARRHTLHQVCAWAMRAGFGFGEVYFEGLYTPFLPAFDWLRAHLTTDFEIGDHRSGLSEYVAPSHRACWLLRLRKSS